jgi:AcrR family transcriptional regulator
MPETQKSTRRRASLSSSRPDAVVVHVPPPALGQGGSLLDAALTIITAEGAAALRVRRVAEVAGCSTKRVYTEYGGKNGLVESICIDGFTKLREQITSGASSMRGLARVRTAVTTYRSWALENPTQYQVMFARAVPEYEPTDRNRQVGVECFEVLVAATAAASSAGEIDAPDPYRTALWLWGLIHGHVMLELARMAPLTQAMDYELLFNEALDRMLAGLRK